ncbi:MAG TPA: hypothetical protein VL549_01050 [Gemmatimonadales bacterium]|jgi:hypothetical protein|nr:hypothetical protein [Gemmatimonadales bacterium]
MARMTLDDFAKRLGSALGSDLVSLLLYGSAARGTGSGSREPETVNTLLIVRQQAGLFDRLVDAVQAWTKAGHPAPLIITEQEWRDSVDAFPIEYEDIRAAHRVLAGKDPWSGIRVRPEDARRQLEHELMGKLMHLRQAYAAAWGKPKRLAEIVRGTRAGFLTMLRAVLRVSGRQAPPSDEALVREAAALIGFAATEGGLTEPVAYLDAVTRTAAYVDHLERTDS